VTDLRVLVLGAAAGGGLPQWNCNGPNSRRFWTAGGLAPATQSSVGVSANGSDWAVLNASPDIRQQIIANPELHPRDPAAHGLRDTPVRSVVLTNGDIDHVAGLLTLREGQRFDLFMTAEIAGVIAANPIFDALNSALVRRVTVRLGQAFEPAPGVTATFFPVPGKVPLYLEGETVETGLVGEQTVGVELTAGGKRACYIPGCARVSAEVRARVEGADLLMFDGTLWTDDEMIAQGLGPKTGARMGHISMSGPDGSIAAWEGARIGRRVFIHINHTNPVWLPDSHERRGAEAAGWEIASDGMMIEV